MHRKSIRRVALLIESHRSYTRDVLKGIRRWMDENERWSTFIEISGITLKPPPWLIDWDGDGIISRTFSKETAKVIKATGLPVVELRATKFNLNYPFVGVDNKLIGQMVAEHFMNRGYRNFGVYSLDTETFFQERVRNFVKFTEEQGHHVESLPAKEDYNPDSWEENQKKLITWLEGLNKPVGILATNDQLGVRILDACQRANIAVPEEIAVVGTENDETLCSFARPPLSSLQFDGVQVGYQAANILSSMMNGNKVEKNEFLIPPKDIVVRASSDDLVINDPIVSKASRLIREQCLSGITVEDVCNTLMISRSTLERRMKSDLGRTAKCEIQRLRFKEVKRLLLETNFTIEAVSELTGFSHPEYFHSAFQSRYGLTPSQFRRNLIQ